MDEKLRRCRQITAEEERGLRAEDVQCVYCEKRVESVESVERVESV